MARFITTRPGGEPSAALSLYVNKAVGDGLPGLQGGRQRRQRLGQSVMMAAYDTCNPAAYKRMIGSGTRATVPQQLS